MSKVKKEHSKVRTDPVLALSAADQAVLQEGIPVFEKLESTQPPLLFDNHDLLALQGD
jgi:hypothetical protein